MTRKEIIKRIFRAIQVTGEIAYMHPGNFYKVLYFPRKSKNQKKRVYYSITVAAFPDKETHEKT
jgi:hypothetical protein